MKNFLKQNKKNYYSEKNCAKNVKLWQKRNTAKKLLVRKIQSAFQCALIAVITLLQAREDMIRINGISDNEAIQIVEYREKKAI